MTREPAAIAELRRSLGELLATFRQAADLTQARLGQITFCDRTRVAHIEKGRARADERFWQGADQVCHADGALMAAFHELQAAKHGHERQAREGELAEARAKAAQLRMRGNGLVVPMAHGALSPSLDAELEQSAPSLEKPWRVSSSTLDAIASVLASTRRLEDQTSAAAVLPSVRNLVGLIDVYAGEARSQVRDQALTLASELHCYVGWLWLDARGRPHAAMHFDTAMSLAAEADSADHLSHAASFKGYMALQTGKLGQAVSLSTVSARDTRTFTALRAFDKYQEAHAYALAGTRRDAENTLLLGDRLLEHVTEDPVPPWAYWYDPPFLLTQRAIVHQALGQQNKAIADFEAGLAEMPPEHRNADWAKDIRARLAALRAL